VQLIVEPVWHLDDFVGVTVLHYDQVVWLEEWAPLLQEIQVPAQCCVKQLPSLPRVLKKLEQQRRREPHLMVGMTISIWSASAIAAG
jgi:hypothetical protein